jgi:hypothetical protein
MFKVGDKVRVKQNIVLNIGIKVGDIGTITKINGKTLFIKFPGVCDDQVCNTPDVHFEPATLSTGDMLNALMANPGQRYLRTMDNGIYGLDDVGTLKHLEHGHYYSADIRDRWTLVPEPPKPVTFLEAFKQNRKGKTTYCNLKDSMRTFGGFYCGSYNCYEIEDGIWTVEE